MDDNPQVTVPQTVQIPQPESTDIPILIDDESLSDGVSDSNVDHDILVDVLCALCPTCNSHSEDPKVCDKCRRPIPKDAKIFKMLEVVWWPKKEHEPKRKAGRKKKPEEHAEVTSNTVTVFSNAKDGAPTPKSPRIEETCIPLLKERSEVEPFRRITTPYQLSDETRPIKDIHDKQCLLQVPGGREAEAVVNKSSRLLHDVDLTGRRKIMADNRNGRKKRIHFTEENDLEILGLVACQNPFLKHKKWRYIAELMKQRRLKGFTPRNVRERVVQLINTFREQKSQVRPGQKLSELNNRLQVAYDLRKYANMNLQLTKKREKKKYPTAETSKKSRKSADPAHVREDHGSYTVQTPATPSLPEGAPQADAPASSSLPVGDPKADAPTTSSLSVRAPQADAPASSSLPVGDPKADAPTTSSLPVGAPQADAPTTSSLSVRAPQANAPATSSLPVGAPQADAPARLNKHVVQKIMVYPPPPAKGGIPINTDDYGSLRESSYLTDVIIDFKIKHFMDHLSQEDQKRTHVFSTYFYTRLIASDRGPNPNDSMSVAERRHLGVRSWTKNVDIFSKDFIIIPINEKAHWYLSIVCFPGLTNFVPMSGGKEAHNPSERRGNFPSVVGSTSITRVGDLTMTDERVEELGDDRAFSSDEEPLPNPKVEKGPIKPEPIKRPCILLFDSLSSAGRGHTQCDIIREYLQVEYNVRHEDSKGKRDITPETFKASIVRVPQQPNGYDCGLYLLQNVEAFFQCPITDYRFPIEQLDWFDTKVVGKKRYEIQQLIHHLMKKQKIDISKLNLPVLNLRPEGTG